MGSRTRQNSRPKMTSSTTTPAIRPCHQGLPSSPVFRAKRSPSRRRSRRRGGARRGRPGRGGRGKGVAEVDDELVDAARLLLGVLEDRLLELGHLVEVLDEVGDGVGVEGAPLELYGRGVHLHA